MSWKLSWIRVVQVPLRAIAFMIACGLRSRVVIFQGCCSFAVHYRIQTFLRETDILRLASGVKGSRSAKLTTYLYMLQISGQFFCLAQHLESGLCLLIVEVYGQHTMRHTHKLDRICPGLVIGSSQRPLPEQYTRNAREEHLWPQRDSKPQYQ